MSGDPLRRGTDGMPVGLRRLDQACAAGLTVVGLVVLASHWIEQGALRGRLVEVESPAPPLPTLIVDLNAAQWPELALLPGVGETMARRIVEVRETTGPFRRVDDLRRVRGIGPRTLERLRPYLRVGDEMD